MHIHIAHIYYVYRLCIYLILAHETTQDKAELQMQLGVYSFGSDKNFQHSETKKIYIKGTTIKISKEWEHSQQDHNNSIHEIWAFQR